MADDERPDVELARNLVVQLAPHEQALFPVVKRTFEADPSGKGLHSGGDNILGFGVSEAATFLSPIALVVAKDVVEYLAAEIGKGLAKEAAGEIMARVRRLIRGEATGDRLEPAQLARVRSIAEDVAIKARLPRPRAEALAYDIVQRLGQP